MIPVPQDLNGIDMNFGNIKHMPKYQDVPDEFKNSNNPYCCFVRNWFFRGGTPEQFSRLREKEGVDRKKALVAIRSILCSFEPKHEHKEAACAYLLAEWFNLEAEAA